MKERDYIDVANLARLRVANYTLRACTFTSEPEDAEWRKMLRDLAKMIERLEERCVCEPEE